MNRNIHHGLFDRISVLKGHKGFITSMLIWNGNLCSSSTDGSIRIWTVDIARPIRLSIEKESENSIELRGNSSPVVCLCIWCGFLSSISLDWSLRLWRWCSTSNDFFKIDCTLEMNKSIFPSNSELDSRGGYKTVSHVDVPCFENTPISVKTLSLERLLRIFPGEKPTSLCAARTYLFVGSDRGSIYLLENKGTDAQICTVRVLSGHSSAITQLLFWDEEVIQEASSKERVNRDSSRVAWLMISASEDRKLCVWVTNTTESRCVDRLEAVGVHEHFVRSLCRWKRFLISGGTLEIVFWEKTRSTPNDSQPQSTSGFFQLTWVLSVPNTTASEGRVCALSICSGNTLASALSNGDVFLWYLSEPLRSCQWITTLTGIGVSSRHALISSCGVLCCGSFDQTVSFWKDQRCNWRPEWAMPLPKLFQRQVTVLLILHLRNEDGSPKYPEAHFWKLPKEILFMIFTWMLL